MPNESNRIINDGKKWIQKKSQYCEANPLVRNKVGLMAVLNEAHSLIVSAWQRLEELERERILQKDYGVLKECNVNTVKKK